jgi:hypothetical protein
MIFSPVTLSWDLQCEADSVSSEWTHLPPRRSGGCYVGWVLFRRDGVVPEEPQIGLGVGLSTSDGHPMSLCCCTKNKLSVPGPVYNALADVYCICKVTLWIASVKHLKVSSADAVTR